MLILLSFPSPEGEHAAARSGNIIYRPSLAEADADTVAQALRTIRPDVVITRAALAPSALAAWRAAQSDAPLLIVDATGQGEGLDRDDIGFRRAHGTIPALQVAERTGHLAMSVVPAVRPSPDRSVIMVGGGVVNLVTALYLVRHGFDVALYDRAPDPRRNAHWTAYGCTRGGGDGRMFTLTEADSYNSRSWRSDGVSNDLLERPISDGGWLVAKPGSQLELERQWAADFHRVPPWLAESYNSDIFGVNRAASLLWTALIDSDPWLFDDSTGFREGILRLYTEDDYLCWHLVRNDRLGATRRVLTPGQIRVDYPALTEVCVDGTVAGGIEVTGFTVQVHRFLAQLVDNLEREGVQFHWNEPVAGIRWLGSDRADGVETVHGVIRSRYYVLSPGAYGDELLRGTATHGKIQGMLGVWLSVPNVEPGLERSLKIARKGHRAEETNVTVGADECGDPTLVCGSGYGWTGLDPGNIDSAELDALFEALEDTVRRFFPGAYAAARAADTLDAGRQLCVRPWTPSCLGVFESVAAGDDGLLVVTGGHNTGGFAQSPVVAEAVLAAFEGRTHPMHVQYHPRRLERFYASATRKIPRPA